jgi:serine protease Do
MGSSDRAVRRRQVLRAGAVAIAAGVAGCPSSDGGSTTTQPTDTSTPTVSEPTATETETETETETPTEPAPEPPGIKRQTVERDKAAITHLTAVVRGDVTVPTFETGSPVSAGVVGTWENTANGNVLELGYRGQFVLSNQQTVSGTYTIRTQSLTLHAENGQSSTYQYQRSGGDADPTLEFYQNGQLVARYGRIDRPQNLDAIDGIQSLQLNRVRGTDAGTDTQQLRTGSTGSGFVVSPDGYIVTNAHVVLADQDPTRMVYQELANQTAVQLRRSVRENFADSELTDSEVREVESILYDKLIDYYAEYAQASNVSESFGVLSGRAGPDEDLSVHTWDATVEVAGQVRVQTPDGLSWGEDVAIVSVDQENLQTVTLGSSEDLDTGEEIFVIGYPNLGINDFFTERNTALEPTLTSGVVSARRTLNSGIETIQTDAAINGGNSGGPMYNSDGEVVGIATFSPASANIQQIEFGLPVELAKQYMDRVGVENTSGELDAAFERGLEAYWRGDCETATAEMQTVLNINSDHPYAQEYITDCQQGDAPGQ